MNTSASVLSRVLSLAATASAFALAACSSSSPGGSPANTQDSGTMNTPDSGVATMDSGGPSGRDASATDGGGGDSSTPTWPSVPTSNTPSATFTNTSTGSTGLVLVSLNFEQSPSAGQEFQEWYAEIGNSGSGPACFVQLQVNYLDSSGNTLATFNSYADGNEYQPPGQTTGTMSNCFAQGTSAGLYDNNFAASSVDLLAVAKVTYSFTQLASPGIEPAPGAPVVESSMLTQGGASSWAVTGNILAPTTVYNLETIVYGVGPDGLIATRGEAINLKTLTQGSTWPYTAQPIAMPIVSRYLQNLTYLNGACTNCATRPPEAPTPEGTALARAQWQEARDRSHANRARFEASLSR
jgi:hypothetical protein